jgi:hypothetical protein
LRAFNDLRGLSLGALDGEIGSVKDAYFDDAQWTLRYFVVTTGSWLSGRDVLIAPPSVRGVSWDDKRLDLNLTREQIQNAPSPETDRPVSRQWEAAYFDYYGYPHYWASTQAWDPIGFPGVAAPPPGLGGPAQQPPADPSEQRGDPHLRSAREVASYSIESADGAIGEVDDFLFDDASWALRFFVIDTRKWLPGRHVLLSTEWIEEVNWERRFVRVAMTREEIRTSPDYDARQFSEPQEESLYRHYGRTPRTAPRVQIR